MLTLEVWCLSIHYLITIIIIIIIWTQSYGPNHTKCCAFWQKWLTIFDIVLTPFWKTFLCLKQVFDAKISIQRISINFQCSKNNGTPTLATGLKIAPNMTDPISERLPKGFVSRAVILLNVQLDGKTTLQLVPAIPCFIEKFKNQFNPRLTKGGGGGNLLQPPLRFFPGRSKTLKKVTKGIYVISFTSFAVIFMKENKNWRYHLTRGRVSRQSQRVGGGGVDATFFSF